ncbi:MAG: hypothetical protein NXI04_09875 [Planctomycetaceae bacterium]|nr:hypothetical protein [Planctomycetaceae bacterium]
MNRAAFVVIPTASLLAGLVCAVVISSQFLGLSAEQKQSVAAFEEMDDREQQDVRRFAQQYQDNDELQQLKELHEAVAADPELDRKLTAFNAWHTTLNQERRNELRPSGEFADNWAMLVSEKYHEDQNRVDEIVIYLGDTPMGARFTVTEHDYAAFIEEIVADFSPEVQAELNGYESSTAVMLAKCTWITQGLFGGRDFKDLSLMFRAIDGVYRKVYSHLLGYGYVQDPDTQQLVPARTVVLKWEDNNRSRMPILVWRVLHAGMTHFGRKLAKESPPPDEERLLTALSDMKRDQQQQMFADISTARRQMELSAIKASEGEKVQALLEEYEIFLQRLEDFRRRMMDRRPSYRGKSKPARRQ